MIPMASFPCIVLFSKLVFAWEDWMRSNNYKNTLFDIILDVDTA